MTEKLSVAFQIAKRLHALAMEQHDARLMIGACNAMSNTPFWMGDFETARRYQKRGVAIWRSGGNLSRGNHRSPWPRSRVTSTG